MKLQSKFMVLAALTFFTAAFSSAMCYELVGTVQFRGAAADAGDRLSNIERQREASRAAFYTLLVSLRTSDMEREGDSRRALDRLANEMESSLKESVESAVHEGFRGRLRSARRASDAYLHVVRKTGRESEDFKRGSQDIRALEDAYAAFGRELNKAAAALDLWRQAVESDAERTIVLLEVSLVALLLLTISLPAVILHQLFRPLQRVISLFRTMEDDEVRLPVPYSARNDEVGDVASCVSSFSAAAEAVRDAARDFKKREEDRERLRNDEASRLIVWFDQEVKHGVETVALDIKRSAEMAVLLERETEESELGLEKALEVARAAVSLTRDAVAATEALASGVQHFAAQIRRSGEFIASSVLQVGSADIYADDLRRAAAGLSGVTELIGEVAGKVNGLALNATIESARAGEAAGRGFITVATEVRDLAVQTDFSARRAAAAVSEMNRAAEAMSFALSAVRESADKIHVSSGDILSVAGSQSRAMEEAVRCSRIASASAEALCDLLEAMCAQSRKVRASAKEVAELISGVSARAASVSAFATEYFVKASAHG